jgi:hypothetical protein
MSGASLVRGDEVECGLRYTFHMLWSLMIAGVVLLIFGRAYRFALKGSARYRNLLRSDERRPRFADDYSPEYDQDYIAVREERVVGVPYEDADPFIVENANILVIVVAAVFVAGYLL